MRRMRLGMRLFLFALVVALVLSMAGVAAAQPDETGRPDEGTITVLPTSTEACGGTANPASAINGFRCEVSGPTGYLRGQGQGQGPP